MTRIDPLSVTTIVAAMSVARSLLVCVRACGRAVAALLRSVPAGTRAGVRIGRLRVHVVVDAPGRREIAREDQ